MALHINKIYLWFSHLYSSVMDSICDAIKETVQKQAANPHITRDLNKSYQVWAFGKLLVLASIWCIVNSRGPAAPENPEKISSTSWKLLCWTATRKDSNKMQKKNKKKEEREGRGATHRSWGHKQPAKSQRKPSAPSSQSAPPPTRSNHAVISLPAI